MKEVHPNLWVGNQDDLRLWNPNRLSIAAAKEPFHREAVGYKERGAPKDSPEYLTALRANRLNLNLVDGPSHKFISVAMIERALAYIDVAQPFLIACNQGMSRSPTIAMMWLAKNGHIEMPTFSKLEHNFEKLYPLYEPTAG